MAEVVVLRAKYLNKKVRVRYVSGNFEGLDLDRLRVGNIAKAAQYLINEQNFTILSDDSDEKGITMVFIRNAPPTAENPLIPVLQERLNTTITVLTDAGEVSGTLTLVGTDVIQITEPGGTVVLIPLSQVNGIV
ncbi:hypothetical protein [Paenibacillus gansuensis]|uniref:Uncharacterized protein n=1 Tax=Paenibacillus gansuensis TaxID=306542 RepID=A0ABW5PCS0_9BACL